MDKEDFERWEGMSKSRAGRDGEWKGIWRQPLSVLVLHMNYHEIIVYIYICKMSCSPVRGKVCI